MKSPNYCIITVAEYQSKSLPKNLELCRQLKTYVEDKLTNTLIYFGFLTTGNYAGALAYFENYSTLRDFEQAFEIYQHTSYYQKLFNGGTASIKSRNFIKYSPVTYDQDLKVEGRYLVLTRVKTDRSMLNTINKLAPIFSRTGALTYRLGSIITGESVRDELLIVSYSSMEQIETAYDLLADSPVYDDLVNTVTVNSRDIIKLEF